MDLSEKDGGLPPDSVVQTIDEILTASTDAVDRWHDPATDSMLRIALAPCSPFPVTTDLLRESSTLARHLGVRMHTHLAESPTRTPIAPSISMPRRSNTWSRWAGWVMTSGSHTESSSPTTRSAASRPLRPASHTAPLRMRAWAIESAAPRNQWPPACLSASGVDGAASNESCRLLEEAHQAVLMARAKGGPTALTTRTAIELATIGGARVLGRDNEIGSVEPVSSPTWCCGIWTPSHSDIDDPVAALVLGAQPPIRGSWINGRRVVDEAGILTVDAATVADDPSRTSQAPWTRLAADGPQHHHRIPLRPHS